MSTVALPAARTAVRVYLLTLVLLLAVFTHSDALHPFCDATPVGRTIAHSSTLHPFSAYLQSC